MALRSLPLAIVGLTLLHAAALRAEEKSRLAVLPTQFDGTAEGQVPKLFDDYLLTAVHEVGLYEVIGQDDINSLLGFEKQKELMGCDDTSCIADLGGALGVERLVVVKIAKIGGDWVVTGKLINIKLGRVEQRSSDFVSGEVKALLRAVPDIVQRLFGARPAPKSNVLPAQSTQASTGALAAGPVAPAPGKSYGRGAKIWGSILGGGGLVMALVGWLLTIEGANHEYCDYYYDPTYSYYSGGCVASPNVGEVWGGSIVSGLGLALEGWGTGLFLNGRARSLSGDGDATGTWGLRWIGWGLVGATTLLPPLLTEAAPGAAQAVAILGTLGAGTIFAWSLWTDRAHAELSNGSEQPFASVLVYPDGRGGTVRGLALGLDF